MFKNDALKFIKKYKSKGYKIVLEIYRDTQVNTISLTASLINSNKEDVRSLVVFTANSENASADNTIKFIQEAKEYDIPWTLNGINFDDFDNFEDLLDATLQKINEGSFEDATDFANRVIPCIEKGFNTETRALAVIRKYIKDDIKILGAEITHDELIGFCIELMIEDEESLNSQDKYSEVYEEHGNCIYAGGSLYEAASIVNNIYWTYEIKSFCNGLEVSSQRDFLISLLTTLKNVMLNLISKETETGKEGRIEILIAANIEDEQNPLAIAYFNGDDEEDDKVNENGVREKSFIILAKDNNFYRANGLRNICETFMEDNRK